MIKFKSNKSGFTLLEILIVLVIVAVLAGLAIPSFTGAVEKSRKQEALTILGAIRSSQVRYQAQYGTYTNVLGNLDFDVTAGAPASPLYAYDMQAAAAATFVARATRTAQDRPAAVAAYTVTINEQGTITAGY